MYDVPVAVKDALRSGAYRKNYRFLVLNDDGTTDFTIDNDNLVSESVSIDERMCSGDTLKFGLCEGSSLEFQYFDHPNITGRRIQCFIDVNYIPNNWNGPWHRECILTPETEPGVYYDRFDLERDQKLLRFTVMPNIAGMIIYQKASGGTQYHAIEESDAETIVYYENCKKYDHFQFQFDWPFELSDKVYVDYYQEYAVREIPMGYFTVKECSRQASTGIIKATCYNKLQSEYLDAKANSLITASFSNPDFPVTFYDIRNVLLDNYEIEKSDFEEVQITRATIGVGTIRRLSGGAISLKAKYGIDSPFNYYAYRHPSTTANLSGYLFAVANETKCEISVTDAYTIQSDYNLDMLEQYYFETISDLLSDSCSVTGDYMSRLINPQTQSSSTYDPYLGWHNYFGVCLEKSNGTKEWYSTIAYQNHLTDVVGTFSDLKNTTITDCVRIYFYIPYSLYLNGNTSFTSNDICTYSFYLPTSRPEGWQYYYYPDSSLSLPDVKYYSFKDINGEVVWGNRDEDWWAPTYRYEDISPADLIKVVPSQLPDITLREAASSTYELSCQYGQLDRETDLFSGAELNHSRLLPADTLYPNNALYPDGAQESAFRSQYSKLWADEGNVHKWRYLIITYKGLDENNQEAEFTLQRTVNADGTDDYNMSDNWLFKNLVWTEAQIIEYATAMVAKMQDITWFPFEMWAPGLPYLETGDEIEIPLGENTYTSYILERQLRGIQNLQDTYINGTLDIF